jgi:hypothetical protein
MTIPDWLQTDHSQTVVFILLAIAVALMVIAAFA